MIDNPIWCPKASWGKKKNKIKGTFKALSCHFFLFLTFSCSWQSRLFGLVCLVKFSFSLCLWLNNLCLVSLSHLCRRALPVLFYCHGLKSYMKCSFLNIVLSSLSLVSDDDFVWFLPASPVFPISNYFMIFFGGGLFFLLSASSQYFSFGPSGYLDITKHVYTV